MFLLMLFFVFTVADLSPSLPFLLLLLLFSASSSSSLLTAFVVTLVVAVAFSTIDVMIVVP